MVQCAELFESIFPVFAFLVVILKTGGGPFCFEQVLDLFKWQAIAFLEFGHDAANGGVHHAAEGQRRFGAFLQRPQISKKVFLRAAPVTVHGGGVQLQRLWRDGEKRFGPLRNTRKNLGAVDVRSE